MKTVWLWLALLAAPAWLVQAETVFDVEAGFAGRVVEGVLVPVHVRVEHQGAVIDGRIELIQTVDSPWHGVVSQTLTQPLRLGQRALKQIVLDFPLGSTVYPLVARLVSDAGETLAERVLDLRDVSQPEPLTVALSETGFPSELPTGERVWPLQPHEVPARAAGFDAIRRLYLGRFSLDSLDPAQREALLHWVMLGGELVVLGGENWYVQQSPALLPWLPLAPTGVETEAQADGTARSVLAGTPRGIVLYAQEGRPRVLRRLVGQGRVWLTMVNPLAAAVPDAFWAALAPEPAFGAELPFESLARDAFLQQSLEFPPRMLVAGLLAAFIAGVGALSWLGMRRPWAVAGLFVWLAGAGGGGVLLLYQADFARALITAEYGVETLLPDGAAHQLTWYGVYAQRREPTVVQFPAAADVRQLLPADRGEHRFDLRTEVADATRLQFQAHPQQIREFLSREETARPQLAWTFTRGDVPTVELLSAIPLERAWLLYEGGVYDLGRIEAGRSRRIPLQSNLRIVLADHLPRVALNLWSWALDQRASPTVLGAWHRQPVGQTRAPSTVDATHLVVAEVGP